MTEKELQSISEDFCKWKPEESAEFGTTCNVYEHNDKLIISTAKSFQERVNKCKEFLTHCPR